MKQTTLLLVLASCLFLSGCHAAAGPQVGYTFDRGLSYGWEAGGGFAFLHGNVGQVIRPEAKPTAPAPSNEWVSYVVAEPWLYVGGTLGLAYSEQTGPGVAVGAWEGVPLPVAGDRSDFDCGRGEPCRPIVTVAGGLRYLNGEFELYFTPKVGFLQTFTIF
jgi:hypothetical protein